MSASWSPEQLTAAVREVLADMLDSVTQQVAARLPIHSDLPVTGKENPVATDVSPLAEAERSGTLIQEKEQPCVSDSSSPSSEPDQTAREDSLRAEHEKLAAAAAELKSLRGESEGFRQASETATALQKLIWPGFLRDGLLADWKDRLERSVLAPDAPAAITLLFAALHTYTAAFADPDARSLHDAMRDVGRRLYAFLKLEEPDADETRSAAVAEQWAEAINQECAGRGEVDVPIPGNAANVQWMSFQPRGGSSPDITAVRSWCVRDAQKRPSTGPKLSSDCPSSSGLSPLCHCPSNPNTASSSS